MTLPPELWIAILCLFDTRRSLSARRQIMHIAFVSRYFHALALPILYAHLPLYTSVLPTNRVTPEILHDQVEQIFTAPAVAALTTLSRRPTLLPAVKSIRFLGHLDTVLLTRRTSTRASGIVVVHELRDLLTATLPRLTSLRSILLSTVAITSNLCNALFHLPALIQLILKDCRAPTPACSIFRDRPSDIRLTTVSLTFSSWSDTPGEVELLSAFVHGPNLEALTTDQPRVLLSLLARDGAPQLRRLELQNFGEGDAHTVTQFLAKECATLQELIFVRCESATWASEVNETFPSLSGLQAYTGPRRLAHWFVAQGSKVERVKLVDLNATEDDTELSDLRVLTGFGKSMRCLDIQFCNASLIDDTTWTTLSRLFPKLRVLRVAHGMPWKEFQVRVLPKCRAALSALQELENLALFSATHIPDSYWQRNVVMDLGRSLPKIREMSFANEATWIRFASEEWKLCPLDDN